MLALVDPTAVTDPPLSPARAELLRLNGHLADAVRDLETANAPLRRVEAIAIEAAQIEHDLAASRAEDTSTLGEWIASGALGERPQPAIATLSLERKLAELHRDLPAVQSVHEALLASVRRASEQVQRLHHERSQALYRAAVEAASAYAEQTWLPAMVQSLSASVPLESLRAELMRIGHGPNPDATALSAAADLVNLMKNTRARAVHPRDDAAGKRFLDALALDPSAEIE